MSTKKTEDRRLKTEDRGTDPVLDIWVKYEGFGWMVAGDSERRRHAGPRMAAEAAAVKMFPQGFKLTRISIRQWHAEAK